MQPIEALNRFFLCVFLSLFISYSFWRNFHPTKSPILMYTSYIHTYQPIHTYTCIYVCTCMHACIYIYLCISHLSSSVHSTFQSIQIPPHHLLCLIQSSNLLPISSIFRCFIKYRNYFSLLITNLLDLAFLNPLKH